MRSIIIAVCLLFGAAIPAAAQVSIGIHFQLFPDLVPVPGYPVYYAPSVDSNLFFYDGLYWVYDDDRWYSSSWYDGPWDMVQAEFVPLFVLRVPVRYYQRPPVYFRGWVGDAPPRWGEHWGHDWEQRRRGWNRWDRASVPARAPLPTYQRQYSGNSYPRPEQQRTLRDENYRYRPHEPLVRQQYQKSPAPPSHPTQGAPRQRPAQVDRPPREAKPQQSKPDVERQKQPSRQGPQDHKGGAQPKAHGQDSKQDPQHDRAHDQ